MINAILTDIEGTTSSITFVKDVLFPYAYDRMETFLRDNAQAAAVQAQLAEVQSIAGLSAPQLSDYAAVLRQWIDEDKKITPLKALQGLIWEKGYQSGDFKADVYPDAYEYLNAWHQHGLPLYVYSSGSKKAQQLFFGYSAYGDLTPLFSGFFDTTSGAKTEPEAYRNILADIAIAPASVLFLSDVEAELDAARAVGLQTVWVQRDSLPENDSVHPVIQSFAQVADHFALAPA